MAQTKQSLDKDLEKIVHVEAAARSVSGGVRAHGIAVVFLVLVALLAAAFSGVSGDGVMVVLAALLGGYMAINIGANDVANNVGPAVGSRAMTLVGALIIAAVFESAGAWVNLATFIGAPVSTTHAVVGGVMGAGIAAVGFQLVNWGTMSAIAASWVISPVLGGVIAAIFLAFIKINIIYQPDKIAAARRWVPMLVAIMAGAFACYLSIKGLKRVWKPDTFTILLIGAVVFAVVWAVMRPLIRRQSEGMENRNQSLRTLFRIPLICSAALLSFAHGANDVANAIGPLAAILRAVEFGDIAGKVEVPAWIMMIGAFGISLGLFLYGPKLIRMVGDQITKMNPMRAYCVALSAAITVIIASWLGLPVSSTHIAVGAVFGVGFFREFYTRRSKRRRDMIAGSGKGSGNGDASVDESALPPDVLRRRKLVRRSHFLTIIAAWVITVPAAALLSAAVFYVLSAVV